MNFLKKNWIVLLLVLGVTIFVTWVLLMPRQKITQRPNTSLLPLRVVASFYPVAEFARVVGGAFVQVDTVTPAGTEPHDYEPTSAQVSSIYRADALLYNGGGVDAWATRIAPDVASHGITTLELSKIIDVVAPADKSADPNAVFDPHFWLDPVLAKKEVAQISQTFSQIDPSHADVYQQNANDYITKLSDLDQSYKIGLSACQNKTVVTSHAAFAYLAKEYGFDVIAIAGLSPEEEPSAGRLAEIAKLAKEKNIQFIYFETLASPKLSQTIANEVGAKTLVFNPLEGVSEADQADGKNYLSIMQENLTNLKIGMLCR